MDFCLLLFFIDCQMMVSAPEICLGICVEKKQQSEGAVKTAPRVLTVRELANYLGVHPSTVYRLLQKNQLPGFRIGSDWRFNVEGIDQWCRRQGAGESRVSKGRRNRASNE